MQRVLVDSSGIVSAGYDPKTRVLEIEFKENRIYQYLEVEPDVYKRFTQADSYGEFFYAHVAKHYRYDRVNEPHVTDDQQPLAFVTGNARKLRGLQQACESFDISIEGVRLPVDEIQSHDAEDVAIKKAKQAYKLAGRPVVVDDHCWNILALRGFPGAYMSYVAGWFKAEDFLALMSTKTDRTIGLTETLVYYDGKQSKVFSEVVWGKIAEAPRGKGIASIDQLVVFDGQTRTIAELEDAEDYSGFENSIYSQFAKWYSLRRRLAMAKSF